MMTKFSIFLVILLLAALFILPHANSIARHIYKYSHRLESQAIEKFPLEYQIKDIPWISYKKWYCMSALLQMIAYKHGIIKEEIGYYNFLMGWTYGASFIRRYNEFGPYASALKGFEVAAPYLSLKMRYLVTDNPDIFLKALKFYISREYPVAVTLNAAVLRDGLGRFDHGELLVGYDLSGFYYYETGRVDRFVEGGKGIKVDNQTLFDAVEDYNQKYFPWKFALIIFEEEKDKEKDIGKIWIRNGKSLIGGKNRISSSGSLAIREFSDNFTKALLHTEEEFIEATYYTRSDNAEFLKRCFPVDKDIEQVSDLLKKAGEYYQQAYEKYKQGLYCDKKDLDIIKSLLYKGSYLEEEAGRIFIKKAKKCGIAMN
jgi:hypothetical protein